MIVCGGWSKSTERFQSTGCGQLIHHFIKPLSATRLHWIVIVRFTNVEFPGPARIGIESEGGKPVGYWLHNDGKGNVVSVILSVDPSKADGSSERHASIAASSFGLRRQPSQREIKAALKACGMPVSSELKQGRECVHAYAESLVSSR